MGIVANNELISTICHLLSFAILPHLYLLFSCVSYFIFNIIILSCQQSTLRKHDAIETNDDVINPTSSWRLHLKSVVTADVVTSNPNPIVHLPASTTACTFYLTEFCRACSFSVIETWLIMINQFEKIQSL